MSKKYIISFAGDTSLGEWYIRKPGKEKLINRLENNPLSFFNGVKPLVKNSDYFLLNLETVLEDSPEPILEGKQYPNYDNPTRTLNVLKDLDVTAVSLANNHSMDFGEKIMLKTLEQLQSAGIGTFGAGANIREAATPYKITLRGKYSDKNIYIYTGMPAGKRYKEYGFFAEKKKPGIHSLPQKGLSRQISRLREEDPESIIIVYPHWQGKDYKWASEQPRIQSRCRAFIDAGANYVFGHGTHMLNDIEHYNGGTIAYSIGNFVFNSPGRYQKMQAPPYSLVVNMEIQEKSDGTWVVNNKFYPIITDNKLTQFNVKSPTEYKQGYFEISNPNNNQHKKFNVLNELNIKLSTVNTERKIERFSESKVLAKEFNDRAIKTKRTGKYLVANINGEEIFFRQSHPSTDSHIGSVFAKDKSMTRYLLKENGLAVADGEIFNRNEIKEALEYIKNFNSVVIKPLSGSMGRGVTTGITNEKEFLLAWEECKRISRGKILIEEQFIGGTEVRYLVIGGEYTASHLRIPPTVIGNGTDTIEKLIEKKNNEKLLNPYFAYKLITLDELRIATIKKHGYELSDILEKDKELIIDSKGGLSTGGDSVDSTDMVHDSFKRIAEMAAKSLPGLDVVGVDILAKNHFEEASEDNYIIVEVNTKPGIGGHIHPSYGTPRNVAKDIVEYIIKKVEKNS